MKVKIISNMSDSKHIMVSVQLHVFMFLRSDSGRWATVSIAITSYYIIL